MPSPVMPCSPGVVFHDGAVWRAVIDTEISGDLSQYAPLTDYRREHQVASFGSKAQLNYTVNIYEAGNILSIVSNAGSHGTHVAGIVSAYYPNNPESNGVAPGCQLVSVKIGDSRLGTMETGIALTRGVIAALQSRVDIINMSYGEPASRSNVGRFCELMKELVYKHNIVFVSSAGNNGPALSTLGTPGGTDTAAIGVGAYVAPPMMSSIYSMREELPEAQYTWSSRGPTADGFMGVTVSAPGGAISPVPNWTLQKNALMNGTSMAAPACAGGIALILSGLKQEGISYNNYTIKRAIKNTARPVKDSDVFAIGAGLMQVGEAYEHSRKFGAEFASHSLRFEIDLPQSKGGSRGIYLRGREESNRVTEPTVRVTTIFHDAVPNECKIAFEKRLVLKSTVPWVKSPKHLMLMHGERTFVVRVDPTELPVGQAHFGEVLAYDAQNRDSGPLFSLPVTVIRPEVLEEIAEEGCSEWRRVYPEVRYSSGLIVRRFLAVPLGATHATFIVHGSHTDAPRRFVLHAVQVLPQKMCSQTELEKYFWVAEGSETRIPMRLAAGSTLEVCIAQWWASLGAATARLQVEFSGIQSQALSLVFNANELLTRVDVRSNLRREELLPSVTLKVLQHPLLPASYHIRPLPDDRDTLPDGRHIYEMILTYVFSLADAGEVRPVASVISKELYDSIHEARFWMIFDSNKRLMGWGDYRPEFKKLPKGNFTIRFVLRHDKVELLEKLKDEPLLLESKLKSDIKLDAYPTVENALSGGSKFSSLGKALKKGTSAVFFLTRMPNESLPKGVLPGDSLLGTIEYYKKTSNEALPGDSFEYLVQSLPKAESAPTSASASAGPQGGEGTVEEELGDFLLEQKIQFLGGLLKAKRFKEFNVLMKDIIGTHPNHLPVLLLQLSHAKSTAGPGRNRLIVDAADMIVRNIDTTRLAIHFCREKLGTKVDPGEMSPIEIKESKELARLKDILVDVLHDKALAVLDLPEKGEGGQLEATLKELQKWTDLEDSKYAPLTIKHGYEKGYPGATLRAINKAIKNSGSGEQDLHNLQLHAVRELGWAHWATYLEGWRPIHFPRAYPLF